MNTAIIIQKNKEYYKDEPCDILTDYESFKSKITITANTPNSDNKKDVEIDVSLKQLSNFWITLEMSLINCEINLILKCSSICIVPNSSGAGTFAIREKTLCCSSKFINLS